MIKIYGFSLSCGTSRSTYGKLKTQGRLLDICSIIFRVHYLPVKVYIVVFKGGHFECQFGCE